MKHKLLGVLVASIFSVPVVATAHSPSAPSAPIVPTSSSTSTATGGAGGSGGSSTGGAATGGSATNSVSGTSANGNTSTVSVSVSLPAESSGSGTTAATDPAATSAQAGDPGSSAFNTKATVEYGGTYTVKSAPAITAPSLTTTLSDTCMGSVSFGLSLTGFGATAASTMVDQACVRRLDSREFRAMGLNDVALALLCQSDANRKAVEATGHDCPGMTRPAVAAANTAAVAVATPMAVKPAIVHVENIRVDTPAPAAVAVAVDPTPVADAAPIAAVAVSTPETEYRDPFIRQRLGLAPLQNESDAK
ncbi:histidine kinase [Glaciimonas sp. GG7]